jgi:hypothetical protein
MSPAHKLPGTVFLLERVLEPATLAITALRARSEASCAPMYTAVPCQRAPCSACARHGFKTRS